MNIKNTAKKAILLAVLSFYFIIPSVNAQVVESTPQEQYIAALQQVINLLVQQVAVLVEQLKVVQASQAQITNQVSTIIQNTTSVPMGATVMNTENSVTPAQLILSHSSVDVIGGNCSGILEAETVFYNGVAPETDTLNITYPDGSTKQVSSRQQGMDKYLVFNVGYVPKIQEGIEFLTISKGGLSKTLTINVTKPDYSIDNPSDSHKIRFNGGRSDGLNYSVIVSGAYFSTTTNQCY